LRSLEYPIEQVPPVYIDESDFSIYRTPTALKIMLSVNAPTASEVVRATWTGRHAADGSTVPDKDFYAVVDYASSLALEALAAIYVQTGDPSIQADVVNYRSKSSEYLTLAKKIRERYFSHMGIDPDATTDNPAALAIGNQHLNQNSGVDRLDPWEVHAMTWSVRISGAENLAPELRAAYHAGLLSGLEKLGIEGERMVQKNITTPYNGMPPAVFTGNLASAVSSQVTDEQAMLRLVIGVSPIDRCR
jgi:hypothetical protein